VSKVWFSYKLYNGLLIDAHAFLSIPQPRTMDAYLPAMLPITYAGRYGALLIAGSSSMLCVFRVLIHIRHVSNHKRNADFMVSLWLVFTHYSSRLLINVKSIGCDSTLLPKARYARYFSDESDHHHFAVRGLSISLDEAHLCWKHMIGSCRHSKAFLSPTRSMLA